MVNVAAGRAVRCSRLVPANAGGFRWLPLVASSLHTCIGLHFAGLPLPSLAEMLA